MDSAEFNTTIKGASIADFYLKCINCKHRTCITEERMMATRELINESNRELRLFSDKVEEVEYHVSTVTSAFLQQKRALEKELLTLDLTLSAMSKEQGEAEKKRDDLLKRAQKHVTQRNFLRRFAGQQQIQLVNEFGPRQFGKGARGGGSSDDTLFQPVVVENAITDMALNGYAKSALRRETFTDHSKSVDDKPPEDVADRPVNRAASLNAFGIANHRPKSPLMVEIHESHDHGVGHVVMRRRSSNVPKGHASDVPNDSRSPSLTSVSSQRQCDSKDSDSDSGIEDLIATMKSKKKRKSLQQARRDSPQGNRRTSRATAPVTSPVKGDRARQASKNSTSMPPASVMRTGSTPGLKPVGSSFSTNHSMRRQRHQDRSQQNIDADGAALDEADRAAEERSVEVDMLIRRLDNSSTEQRANNVLAWYRSKLADEAEREEQELKRREEARKTQEEEAKRLAEEAEVLKRRQDRNRRLFREEYASVRKMSGPRPLDGDSMLDDAKGCFLSDPLKRSPEGSTAPHSHPPEEPTRKSIFDNPKYRIAAIKSMSKKAL